MTNTAMIFAEPTLRNEPVSIETAEREPLRLCLRHRAPVEPVAITSGRKRKAPAAEAERPPLPKPRIIWRREDEHEMRAAPAIIVE